MPKRPRRLRRAAHVGLALILGLVALLVLAVLTLQIKSARRELLEIAVQRIQRALPGNVQIVEATWPRLSELQIRRFSWTTAADTLAAGSNFVLRFNPRALSRRHLQIHEIALSQLRIDLPAIKDFLEREGEHSGAGRERTGVSRPSRNAAAPFLRTGALSGMPSLEVEKIIVSAPTLVLSSEISVDSLELQAAADFTHHRVPRLFLRRLQLQVPQVELAIDTCTATVDLESARLEAHAVGFYGREWPFMLSASTDEKGQFEIVLQETSANTSPHDVGLRIAGTFNKTAGKPESVDFTGELRTPGIADLRRSPALAAKLHGLPELGGIRLGVGGHLVFSPEFASEIEANIEPSSWLDAGRIRLRTDSQAVVVDTFALAFRDFSLHGRWRRNQNAQDGEVELHASGLEWLQPYLDEKNLPDSLAVHLKANVEGNDERLTLSTIAEARFHRGALHLDMLRVAASVPRLQDPEVRLHVLARTPELAMGVRGDLLPGSPLEVHLTPFEVAAPQIARLSSPALPIPNFKTTSKIEIHADSSLVLFENLQLTGALGDVSLTGRLQEATGGRARLVVDWPEPPQILMARLQRDAESKVSLRQSWQREAQLGLTLETTFGFTPEKRQIQAVGRFALPGPRTLAPLLATTARLDDLEDLQGELRFGMITEDRGQNWDLQVDLDETAWIDSSAIQLHGNGKTTVLDSVQLQVEGLNLRLGGSIQPDSLDIAMQISLQDGRLGRRFVPQLDDELELELDASAQVQGAASAPDVKIDLRAHFKEPGFAVPELLARAEVRKGQLQAARLEAMRGVSVQLLQLDEVRVTYDALEDTERQLPARIVIEAKGVEEELFSVFEIERDAGVVIHSETLNLALSGRQFRSQAPFEAHVLDSGGGFRLTNLNLEGSSGHLRANGVKKPDSLLFNLDASLELPEQPDWLALPEGLWPASVTLQSSTLNGDVKLDLEARDLKIGTRTGLDLKLQLLAQQDSLSTILSIRDGQGEMVQARGVIPASWNLAPPALNLSSERVVFDANLKRFPLPPRGGDPTIIPGYLDRQRLDRVPYADARLRVRGSLPQPEAQLIAQVDFPDWADLSLYEFKIQADLVSQPESNALQDGIRGQNVLRPRLRESGLQLVLVGNREKQNALQGEFRAPLKVSLQPFSVQMAEEEALFLQLHTPELQLADFNPLLPGGIQLQGTLQSQVQASGTAGDPKLDGHLNLPALRMTRSDGLRAQAKGGISIKGSGQRPVIDGRIQLNNGVIPVPDPPKALLPTAGAPLLQSSQNDSSSAQSPQAAATDPRTNSNATAESLPTAANPILDNLVMDVTLSVPSGVWIRGKGLEVEVSGDLRLQQQQGRTMLVGELQAVRGNLALQGRKIPIKSGKVIFYGDDETNPTLDLLLEKSFQEVTVRVTVSGKVKDPKLELGSDPELSDQDILSYLFFGRPFKSLDNPQTIGLEQRAVAIASTFATSQVTGWLSQELGLEMLSIEASSEKEDVTSLVVGKYISPNILLKYAQDLEKGRGFSINLEYWLARGLKLATYTSRYDQSGVELNWSKDY